MGLNVDFSTRKLVATGLLSVLAAASLVATTTDQALAVGGCKDGDRDTAAYAASTGRYIVPVNAQPVYVWNRKVELRYIGGITRCGWALISQGNDGDEVWIERSSNPGTRLGDRRIQNGNRSTYTGAYNDAGTVVRACGKAGNRVEVACTNWF